MREVVFVEVVDMGDAEVEGREKDEVRGGGGEGGEGVEGEEEGAEEEFFR